MTHPPQIPREQTGMKDLGTIWLFSFSFFWGGFTDILNPLKESIIVNISGDVSQYYYDNY